MTPKERWLAAIHLKPLDRLPFWPKLSDGYLHAQTVPFRGMDLDSIHDFIGSDKHKSIEDCTREVRTRTSVEKCRNDGTMQTVFKTPHGEMRLVQKFDVRSNSWHPTEFPVSSLEDIKLMTAVFEDVTVELDTEALRKATDQSEAIGQTALTHNLIGESPLMYLIEWLAGVEQAHFLLVDYREEVEGLFTAIHSALKRKTELLCEYSPADVFYLIENTSTTLISPSQHTRYCANHVREYAEVTKSFRRNLILHMCGHLKALLPALSRIPVQAFEAFTSPTLGDTTLLDGRRACPDKCLIGGTNAMLWTKTADEIIDRIDRDLNDLPHHRGIVVTSAGVMPPMCKPETIRDVCEWVKSYSLNMNERLS